MGWHWWFKSNLGEKKNLMGRLGTKSQAPKILYVNLHVRLGWCFLMVEPARNM
jgi:hypothetical protein